MNDRGLSLAEVLTVISMVGVLTAISIPPFIAFKSRSLIIGSANRLTTDMQLARNKALNSGDYVAVMFQQRSYYIFVDNGAGGGKAGDYKINGDEVIMVKRAILPLLSMRTSFTGKRYRFKTFGRIKPGSVIFTNGTGGTVKVIVSAIGRMRTETSFKG